jgi:hypothetical protein
MNPAETGTIRRLRTAVCCRKGIAGWCAGYCRNGRVTAGSCRVNRSNQ